MDEQRDIRGLPEILRNDVRKINNQYQVMKTGNSRQTVNQVMKTGNSRQTVKGLLGVSIFGYKHSSKS